MKVIAVNGSHNADGNTWHCLKVMCDRLEELGIETEILHIGKKAVQGCMGCGGCRNGPEAKCVFEDVVNEHAAKIRQADGVIFGSPVHYAGLAGDMKSYMDRLFFSAAKSFKYKPVSCVAALRRSGGVTTTDAFTHYFQIAGMLMAPSCYWNAVHGDKKGEVLQDQEGVDTLRTAAENLGWLVKMLAESKVPLPQIPARQKTNFIL